MGCDIHLYFEKKNKDGKWERIDIDERLVPDERNYRLFAFLADIRYCSDFKFVPQFAGRRIPEDASIAESDADGWLGDFGFTQAYLNEILAAPWEEAELEDCYFKVFCDYIIPKLVSWCGCLSREEEKDIRVLIGFDN